MWVPRGSLADLLEDKSQDLRWDEPLLRFATDVARGMAYLHAREYFDERTHEYKRCIIHRDLKPDNALVWLMFFFPTFPPLVGFNDSDTQLPVFI
jgi:serine/threonine protein kinase